MSLAQSCVPAPAAKAPGLKQGSSHETLPPSTCAFYLPSCPFWMWRSRREILWTLSVDGSCVSTNTRTRTEGFCVFVCRVRATLTERPVSTSGLDPAAPHESVASHATTFALVARSGIRLLCEIDPTLQNVRVSRDRLLVLRAVCGFCDHFSISFSSIATCPIHMLFIHAL